jgi:hypothetical protein
MFAVDISTNKYPLADLIAAACSLLTPHFRLTERPQISRQSAMWPPPLAHYCHRLDRDIDVGDAHCSSLTARATGLLVVKLLIKLRWRGIALPGISIRLSIGDGGEVLRCRCRSRIATAAPVKLPPRRVGEEVEMVGNPSWRHRYWGEGRHGLLVVVHTALCRCRLLPLLVAAVISLARNGLSITPMRVHHLLCLKVLRVLLGRRLAHHQVTEPLVRQRLGR